jgi:uncharacterized protein YfaP (DUF2135 family)
MTAANPTQNEETKVDLDGPSNNWRYTLTDETGYTISI